MKKLLFAVFAAIVLTISAPAQSGVGAIRGFVVEGIRNGSSVKGANVELRAIENHSGTKTIENRVTDRDGFYQIDVSFGYYLLTIKAEGYETYQTKVYIPSSRQLEWGTMLEKAGKKDQ